MLAACLVASRVIGPGGRWAEFRSLKDAWADTTTPHGRLMVTVLAGLAEFERELIVAQTSEGRARAKTRGVKLGPRFKLSAEQRAYIARERAKRREHPPPRPHPRRQQSHDRAHSRHRT